MSWSDSWPRCMGGIIIDQTTHCLFSGTRHQLRNWLKILVTPRNTGSLIPFQTVLDLNFQTIMYLINAGKSVGLFPWLCFGDKCDLVTITEHSWSSLSWEYSWWCAAGADILTKIGFAWRYQCHGVVVSGLTAAACSWINGGSLTLFRSACAS